MKTQDSIQNFIIGLRDLKGNLSSRTPRISKIANKRRC